MKITTTQLKQIIREEIKKQSLREGLLDSIFSKFKSLVQGAKEWAGKKGITFGNARRPTDAEYELAKRLARQIDAIGVDKVTGNIYVYNGREQMEYIISSTGKVLSKAEGFGF